MAELKPTIRLWLVAAILLATGLASRLVLNAAADAAFSYPAAVQFQGLFFSAGLLVLALACWWMPVSRWRWGCVGWLVAAAACGFALLSSVPK